MSGRNDINGSMTAMHTVAVLAYADVRLFDLAVALEVWGVDRTDVGVPAFELRLCTYRRRPVRSDLGPLVTPTHGLRGLVGSDLIVVLGLGDLAHPLPEPVLQALRGAHRAGTVVAALCSGAVVLARTGLLDGHRATTHWMHTDYLQTAFPAVTVETDRLFLEDRGCWTSAGATAGLDLCLHLVRLAHGAGAAATIARRMVTPPHREGSQRQFVDHPLHTGPADKDLLSSTMQWVRHHIGAPLTVEDIARHTGVSTRTLARRFADTTGTTPMSWLIHERVQFAQQLLETTNLPVASVAQRAGFGSPLTLRRHFERHLKMTPATYRRTFVLDADVEAARRSGCS